MPIVMEVEPEQRKKTGFFCSRVECPSAGFPLLIITFMLFFIIGCGYISFYIAQYFVSCIQSVVVIPVNFVKDYLLEMESHYAEIVYVELKRNIHIPIDWPIQGIKGLVIRLAEKIISDPEASYVMQVNNIPAKLIRRQTESGCVNVFQKIPHKKMENSHLYDVVFSIDEYEIKVEIFSEEYQKFWPNYCAIALLEEKEMSYHTVSPYLKEKRSTANDPVPRHMLRRIKRIFK